MLSIDADGLLNVHHRVDGLENQYLIHASYLIVHHRVDGLEIFTLEHITANTVHHRVDGLEITFRHC